MVDLTALREDMEIVSSDGRHVGEIDHVRDGEVQLKRRDSEAETEPGSSAGHSHHHFIPIDWVSQVDSAANRATLSVSKDEAESRWRHG